MEDCHPSIVEYYSKQRKGHCGYCSSKSGSCTYGLHAHVLTVEDYQNLIDRGWRRCGQYCYKSIMDKTCCPLYTIRCDVKDFRLSKTQKKILKRFNHFLATGTITKGKSYSNLDIAQHMEVPNLHNEKNETRDCGSNPNFSIVTTSVDNEPSNINNSRDSEQTTNVGEPIKTNDTSKSVLEKPVKNKTNKAKYMRIQRKKLKLQKLGLSEEEIARKLVEKKKYPNIKTIEDFVKDGSSEKNLHKLKISLVRSCPPSEEYNKTFKVVFDLYKRYQLNIHKDPPEKITEHQFERFLVVSPLKIRLLSVTSSEFKETYNDSASLFLKYQKLIHHESEEECSVTTFNWFLVESPLKASGTYGSYHQQYWLDDKLIAVGVIDILPKCVSSVYFFYDPEYSHLSLGVYGALREIEFTRRLSSQLPDMNFYYMGFYIHTCVKMKYKSAFKPSYLLCPEVYTWHPIVDCIPKLNIKKYTRLNDDSSAVDSNSSVSPADVLVLYNRTAMPLLYYLSQKSCSTAENVTFLCYIKTFGWSTLDIEKIANIDDTLGLYQYII